MTLKRTIIYGGLWGDMPIGVEIPKRDTKIMACDLKPAAKIIKANHYSKSIAAVPSHINLLVYYQEAVHGALMLGKGINPTTKHSTGEVVDFDRMWLSDDMPHCSETVVLGALNTYLRARYPNIRFIRSWSDTGEGNMGTIYKAANYRYVKSCPSSFYRNKEGNKIHEISIYHKYNSQHRKNRAIPRIRLTKEAMASFGYTYIANAPQYLFEYDLHQ